MSDMPDHGFPLFMEATNACEQRGLAYVNPAEFGVQEDYAWEDYMRRDIKALMECNAILLLPGWRQSKQSKACGNRASKETFSLI